ncbi:MAG TPA: NAD-dependent epimerase/dehydratase family protein [Mycobacteriales bacterium]|nr:NAD-dependent epimerase/dehydratase family protein [Mycobacteriales bacterium]
MTTTVRGGSVVAVTGSSGALGSGVVRRLAALPRGSVRRVVAIDTAPADEPWPARVHERVVDVRDAMLSGVFDGADVVVHLAGLHRPGADPDLRREVNVRGTESVLLAAVAAEVSRVVLVTSAMVYGALPDNPVPLTEDAPLRAPRDRSLVGDFVEVERLVEQLRGARVRPEITVLRPTTLVGPGADSVLTRHFESPRLLVVRGSTPRWQFCHLADLQEACVIAATTGLGDGAVNVSPPGWLTQQEVQARSGRRALEMPATVATAAAERLHRAGLTLAPSSEIAYLAHPWLVDSSRLHAAGWRPAYDHAAGLDAQLAVASGHTTVAGRRFGREDATRAAAGATVALLGTAAVVRRARRRRR